MICDAQHPYRITGRCTLQSGNHPMHSGYDRTNREDITWDNQTYVEPVKKATTPIKDLAKMVPKPNARASDPANSHTASAAYAYKRSSRKGAVAQYLLDHVGEWVDAVHFTHEDVGGFAGTRRLRELREDHGWPIETRQKPGASNTWQHMLPYVPRED